MNILRLFGIGKNDGLPTKREVLKSLATRGYYENDGLKFGLPGDDNADGYIYCNTCCEAIERCEYRNSEAIIALIRRR